MKQILPILMILLLTTCNRLPDITDKNQILPWIRTNITYQEQIINDIVYSQHPRAVLKRKTATCVGYVGLAMYLLRQFNEESYCIVVNETHTVLFWNGLFYETIRGGIIPQPEKITDILTFNQFIQRFY